MPNAFSFQGILLAMSQPQGCFAGPLMQQIGCLYQSKTKGISCSTERFIMLRTEGRASRYCLLLHLFCHCTRILKQSLSGYTTCYGEVFRGGGATLNGKAIRVSEASDVGKALIATELGTARDAATFAAVTSRMAVVAEKTQSVR